MAIFALSGDEKEMKVAACAGPAWFYSPNPWADFVYKLGDLHLDLQCVLIGVYSIGCLNKQLP